MKVQVTAKAPTSYQIQSLKGLSGIRPVSANPDGSFEFIATFSSRAEAIKFLKTRAYKLYDDPIEYKEAIGEINKYGMLTYDCLTARIEKI